MTIKRDELDQTDFSDIATGRSIPEFDPTPTPRVDRFIAEHPLRLPEHLKSDVAAVIPMRQFMIDWAEFARELEREIQHSVPKEWNIPPHRK